MNAEKLVMDWLNAAPRVKVIPRASRLPPNPAPRTVSVRHRERTGGSEGRFVSRPLIAVQVWAASRWEASDVAQRLVLPRLKRIVELPEVAIGISPA